jgi:hypothetical protein
MLLPACEAKMVQVPLAINEAVVPDTVHTLEVDEAKATVKPELAVALKVAVVPAVGLAIAGKLMLCASPPTLMFCVTFGAAA